MSRYVYLDWNVLNKIEHLRELPEDERRVYATIEALILEGKIITPYSNAHINDLVRGYNKNPIYTEGHLQNIDRLTNSLCIVQYWGKDCVMWHYRSAEEFLNSIIKNLDNVPDSFMGLMDWGDETGLMSMVLVPLRLAPVPANFKEIYNADPIFNLLFPRTKENMNMLALCEDLYALSYNSNKDYSLFKDLKTYINQSRVKLKHQHKSLNDITKEFPTHPAYLNYDELLEEYAPKSKTSDNPIYQKITDTYIKLDLQGYKSDDRFSNLIDDSLHVFYGAHCDYFITLDDKCHYKAAETYHRLGIATKALKPREFVDNLTIFISEQ